MPDPRTPPEAPTSRTRSLAVAVARDVALGALVGVLAGLSSAAFLWSLEHVTEVRVEHPWLVWLLPVAGLATGLAYHHLGGRASGGNVLILDEVHEPTEWVPRRMAPLVFVGTIATHLFGGSAGREGTALQMSGSLTDHAARLLHLGREERRALLVAALAGGFGAVFGVPFAGVVFGLEVQPVRALRRAALVPAVVASFVGDQVVRRLGVHHTATPALGVVRLTPGLVGKVLLAGLACGLVARAFVLLTHQLKRGFTAAFRWPPLRTFVGGAAVVALTVAVRTHDYDGLSLPLLTRSLAGGAGIVAGAFALKLLFTAVTLGSGFQGGEVTPLFVIGATLGVSLGRLLGVPAEVLAPVGFVAVFAGAANVPVACTVMAVELFGRHGLAVYALGCGASFLVSSRHGIYGPPRRQPAPPT